MGHLIKGEWKSGNVVTSDESGAFDREESVFRNDISPDNEDFPAESGRYHLYVSYACPWAHRTLIARRLKKLENHVSVDVVHPDMLENSWTFDTDFPGTTGDSLHDKNYLYEIYQLSNSSITAKVTVPVLWDKKEKRIVNNESAEIVRMFNSAFNHITGSELDLYPEAHRQEIEALNAWIYPDINNGVYKTGFAKTQKAYEAAFKRLFQSLDKLEQHLEGKTYLVSDGITEADVRLVTTLLRFDPVYHTHFKCNGKRMKDYKNISNYLDLMNQNPAVSTSTHVDHFKRHYYYSHDFLNPCRIIPLGPLS